MPTNTSTPIWRCDICGARFDQDYEAACRCEAAGPPLPLPDGELVLSHHDRDRLGGAPSGFRLEPLFADPEFMGTLASRWSEGSGHTVQYWVGVDPADHYDHEGRLRPPYPAPRLAHSQGLWPHRPGLVQQDTRAWVGRTAQPGTGARADVDEAAAWVLEAVDLACADRPVGATASSSFARPLTDEVAAVLDALGATVEPARPDGDGAWRWGRGRGIGALATEAAAHPTRAASTERATWWLSSVPAQELARTLNQRWLAWRAGAPGDVPLPSLRCRRQVSASKLTRPLRELVAATGVAWPVRTTSDRYAELLVQESLGYIMETTDRLFDVPRLVTVGGRKGGVGKSTVAAALATRLAADGAKVVLVDCDLTGPSQHLVFGLGPVQTDTTTRRLRPSPTPTPGLSVFSPGQLFGPEAKARWDTTTVGEWLSFLGSCLDLDDTEVVVVDMPPGTGAVHDVMCDSYRVRRCLDVQVTTAHPLALADAERELVHHSHHDDPYATVVVENLSRASGRTATGELAEIRLMGEAGATEALAERMGHRYGGSLPWAPEIAELAACEQMAALAEAVRAAAVPGDDEPGYADDAPEPDQLEDETYDDEPDEAEPDEAESQG